MIDFYLDLLRSSREAPGIVDRFNRDWSVSQGIFWRQPKRFPRTSSVVQFPATFAPALWPMRLEFLPSKVRSYPSEFENFERNSNFERYSRSSSSRYSTESGTEGTS